jgi:hypothetical protein
MRKGHPQTNPRSIANLTGIGAAYRFGGPLLPRCECGQPSVRGTSRCRRHGGSAHLALQGRGSQRGQTHRALMKAQRLGQIPDSVLRHPAWIAARSKPHRFALVARDMVAAMVTAEATGDWSLWTRALAAAKADGVEW